MSKVRKRGPFDTLDSNISEMLSDCIAFINMFLREKERVLKRKPVSPLSEFSEIKSYFGLIFRKMLYFIALSLVSGSFYVLQPNYRTEP